ncbi:MAG: hypothetical protein PHI73_03060 [Patescibacteria group bacterium]|nr:hypothetical protein [Patescibacteria group bacterium]
MNLEYNNKWLWEWERREMNSTDPTRPNISRCMTMADFAIDNNRSFDELYEKIDKELEKYANKHR